jgi:hypothetical protein
VTYRCEAWTLTTRDEQHLRIFEHKILRKIFGPVQDKDGSWRIRMNHKLNELIGHADIVRFIKSRRIAWLGHVMWMDEKRIPKRVLGWKPTSRRISRRPRTKWIKDTEEDIQALGIRGWRKLRKGQNGGESLRRLKSTVGCNANKRRKKKKKNKVLVQKL